MTEEKKYEDELENEGGVYIIKLVSGELLIAETDVFDVESFEYLSKFTIYMFAKVDFEINDKSERLVYLDSWIPGYEQTAITIKRKHVLFIDEAPEYLKKLYSDFVSAKLEELLKQEKSPDDKKLLH